MVIQGDVISLNKKEVLRLASKQCNKRLHMTIGEFNKKRKAKELPDSMAVHDIEMILRLAK